MVTGFWCSRTGPIRVAERMEKLQCRSWTVVGELRLTMAMRDLGTASGGEESGVARKIWSRVLFATWAPRDGPCRMTTQAEGNAGQASNEWEVCRQRQCGCAGQNARYSDKTFPTFGGSTARGVGVQVH